MTRLRSLLRGFSRVLLGLFICWQLLFLFLANGISLEQGIRQALWHQSRRTGENGPASREGRGPWRGWIEGEKALRHWSEAIGQRQAWQLFAPEIAEIVSFPVVKLGWDDLTGPSRPDPVWLKSFNSVDDRRHFFRAGHFRMRRYESALHCEPLLEGTRFRPDSLAWAEAVRDFVFRERYTIRTYLRHRVEEQAKADPDGPLPTQAILYIHFYRIPPPPGPHPWDWADLGTFPLARWVPHSNQVQVFDPEKGEFEKEP